MDVRCIPLNAIKGNMMDKIIGPKEEMDMYSCECGCINGYCEKGEWRCINCDAEWPDLSDEEESPDTE